MRPRNVSGGSTAMTIASEKDLDRALEAAFKHSETFSDWFLRQTKFAELGAAYSWSRSNYPWGKVTLEVTNPETGEPEVISREGETDVLVVFEARNQRRVAVHVENKLANGKFMRYQSELYAARAEAWKGNALYGNYEDWETILLAPRSFHQRF